MLPHFRELWQEAHDGGIVANPRQRWVGHQLDLPIVAYQPALRQQRGEEKTFVTGKRNQEL